MTYLKNIEPNVAVLDDDIANWDKETDIAIVGFGGAGGCAAIAAADQNARVEIFEVASASGGAGPSVDEAAPMFRSRALLSFTAFEPFGVLLRSVGSRHVAPTSAAKIYQSAFSTINSFLA